MLPSEKKVNSKKDFHRRVIKSLNLNWLLGIVGLIVLMTITVGVFLFYKNSGVNKIKNNDNDIVAPYYEMSVFKLPKDLEKPQDVSSAVIRLPIVMYHYIEYVQDQGDFIRKRLDITPANFEKQLKSLKEAGYTTYFVKDIPRLIKEGQSGEKSVVLTFDDGYEDFYTNAFPILKKYQMKATAYIVFNFIDKRGYLTQRQLREIADSNLVEIGSHTLDHISLKQASPSVARKQIFDSKRLLEESLAIHIETFAYPYGSFSKETVDLVKEASYTAAVSVIPGVSQSGGNLFFLSRIRSGRLTGNNAAEILERLNR